MNIYKKVKYILDSGYPYLFTIKESPLRCELGNKTYFTISKDHEPYLHIYQVDVLPDGSITNVMEGPYKWHTRGGKRRNKIEKEMIEYIDQMHLRAFRWVQRQTLQVKLTTASLFVPLK